MRIRWLGHSCFFITTGRGVKIVTDPYGKNINYTLPKISADIVLLSHHHFDHNAHWRIEGKPRVIKRTSNFYEEHEVNIKAETINFKGLPTFHDTSLGKKKGPNTVFLWAVDGVRFAFLGDLGHPLSEEDYEKIGEINVIFIPVGGLTTIDAKEASEIVKRLNPGLVFPMHYKTEYFGESLKAILSDDETIFLARMKDVRKLDTDSFNFNPEELKESFADGPRVYLLKYIPSEE